MDQRARAVKAFEAAIDALSCLTNVAGRGRYPLHLVSGASEECRLFLEDAFRRQCLYEREFSLEHMPWEHYYAGDRKP